MTRDPKVLHTCQDFLSKARDSVKKDVCLTMLQQNSTNIKSVEKDAPKNLFPARIPELREQINFIITQALVDCKTRLKKFFDFSRNTRQVCECGSEDCSVDNDYDSLKTPYEETGGNEGQLLMSQVNLRGL